MRSLRELDFDNTFARLPETFFQRVLPTPLPSPSLVSYSDEVSALLGLDPGEKENPALLEYFSGHKLLPGSEPLAAIYAGHQFGVYVPQLGDGRAILLGEVRNPQGERWDLQLKGSGRTAYSRFGDGRAVLRSCIREYLASEAMAGLGIPTTRALCVLGSPLQVYRESPEPAAMLVRVAPSHVRFGSFEVYFWSKQIQEVRVLADYVIQQSFPHLKAFPDRYERFFAEVVDRTARLVAEWQAVGFAHGVLNTDNMSILGITLDYGPFGFMEAFEPGFICNHSDEQGRYAFDQQPRIAYWNLACLARTFTPLVEVDKLRAILESYGDRFNQAIHKRMCQKIGISGTEDGDDKLWQDLLDLLALAKVDYTNFFRGLCDVKLSKPDSSFELNSLFASPTTWKVWLERYLARLQREHRSEEERLTEMKRVNPKYVLRNYLAQVAIERAQYHNDFSEVNRLLNLLRKPYDEQPGNESYAQPAPEWGRRLVISCSS